MIVQTALTTGNAVKDAIVAFRDADCDELVLAPCDPGLEQVDALAAVGFTSV